MINSKKIREKLKKGEPSVGTWLQLPCRDSAEIISRLGYEWVAVDLEHGAFTRADLPDMFRSIERFGSLPFARLAEATMENIKAALDSGARGLIFPMIETRKQLEDAIAWSLYPGGSEFPKGKRGVGFSRANVFGVDFDTQTKSTGPAHDIVLVAQIEHVNALSQLDDIFSNKRLDAYMIGPYDLSASMGLTAQFSNPIFIEALQLIENKATEHGVAKGYHVVQPDQELLQQKISEGYAFLAYGMDSIFLQSGGRHPFSS